MSKKMNFEFNSRRYQREAIDSVIDLFVGQPTVNQKFELAVSDSFKSESVNKFKINKNQLLSNLNTVQERNNRKLAPISNSESLERLEYSIEMETGTGKTYIYLKTIVELSKKYGWNKYIIVVPNIAIKEGVISELSRTRNKVESENNLSIGFLEYDSKRLSGLERYYQSPSLEIMLMTMQSFNSDNNILNKERLDSMVRKPIELIQKLKPIVILDEPQSMEGDATQEKLKDFNSLFILRYSATHRKNINTIYRYTPIDAYREKYVKKIEVLSVFGSKKTDVKSYVEVREIQRDNRGELYASIKFYKYSLNGIKVITKKVKTGHDLFKLSNEMYEYQGFKVIGINFTEKTMKFENGLKIKEGNSSQSKDDLMRIQIRETIKAHFDKEIRFKGKGIKVLSLFFIDRVKNYRDDNAIDGKGKIKIWFEEEYQNLVKQDKYKEFSVANEDLESIQTAYFSVDKKGIKDTLGNSKFDKETYELIMKNKEKLLDVNVPQRFIFSHTALREGWDNPNIFQICTLNETHSEIKKRQEIGRGLRLPVNQSGKRIMNENINILTVIANESYETFAKGLQNEIKDETGIISEDIKPANANDRKPVKLKRQALEHPEFKKLWSKINKKTTYSINIDENKMIDFLSDKVRRELMLENIQIRATNILIDNLEDMSGSIARDEIVKKEINKRIPNYVKRISDYTGLTKKNVINIIRKSEVSDKVFINPDLFIKNIVNIIKSYLPELLKEGIKYEQTGETYDLKLFSDEIQVYEKHHYLVNQLNTNKTLYDTLLLDSDTEVKIVKELNMNEAKIKFYLKLPNWFKVSTPVGSYNPDWAIVLSDDSGDKLYLVRESKFTGHPFNVSKLRFEERNKIEYGKHHFDSIDVDYQVIQSADDLLLTKERGIYPFDK